MKHTKRNIIYLSFIILLLVIWEYQSGVNNISRLLISSPSLIVDFISEKYLELFEATYITFFEAFLGLIIAIIFSFITMVLCLYFKNLLSLVMPVMVFSQVIPLITLAPLFIILFGIGVESKIMMAALICYFPIFVNFSNGIRQIDKNLEQLMFIYSSSRWQNIRHLYIPLSLPSVFSGLKVASTLAVIGAIVAEFNGTEVGLGKNLFLAAKRLEPDLMMASLLLSSLLGGMLYITISLIERKIGKWYLS